MKRSLIVIMAFILPQLLSAQSMKDQVRNLNELFSQGKYQQILETNVTGSNLGNTARRRLSTYASYIKAKAAEKTGETASMEFYYLDVLNTEKPLPDSERYLTFISCLSLTEYYMRQGLVYSAINILSELLRLRPYLDVQQQNAADIYNITPPSADAVLTRANRILSLYFVRLLDAYGKPVILFTIPVNQNYTLDRFPYTSSVSPIPQSAPPVSVSNTRIIFYDGLYRVTTNTFFSREREADLFAQQALANCDGFDYILKDMGVHGWIIQLGAYNTLEAAFEKAEIAENCWNQG